MQPPYLPLITYPSAEYPQEMSPEVRDASNPKWELNDNAPALLDQLSTATKLNLRKLIHQKMQHEHCDFGGLNHDDFRDILEDWHTQSTPEERKLLDDADLEVVGIFSWYPNSDATNKINNALQHFDPVYQEYDQRPNTTKTLWIQQTINNKGHLKLSKLSSEELGWLNDLLEPPNNAITTLTISQTAELEKLSKALKVNTSLRELNLSSNNIGGRVALYAIMDALKINKSVKILNLRNSNITFACAKIIAEMLKFNKTLKELNLSFNRINPAFYGIPTLDGLEAIAEALRLNETLGKLDLRFNGDDNHPSTLNILDSINCKLQENLLPDTFVTVDIATRNYFNGNKDQRALPVDLLSLIAMKAVSETQYDDIQNEKIVALLHLFNMHEPDIPPAIVLQRIKETPTTRPRLGPNDMYWHSTKEVLLNGHELLKDSRKPGIMYRFSEGCEGSSSQILIEQFHYSGYMRVAEIIGLTFSMLDSSSNLNLATLQPNCNGE